jgi:hypothetical protein
VISDQLDFTLTSSFANCPDDGQDAESLLALAAERMHEIRQERLSEATAG